MADTATTAPTATPIRPFPASQKAYLPGSRPDLRARLATTSRTHIARSCGRLV